MKRTISPLARRMSASVKRTLAHVVRPARIRLEIDAAARKGIVPPRRLWPMVGGDVDFVAHGREFFQYLVEHGGVSETSSVLDIGCGLGKHAIHFAKYLRPPGRYEGFDVEPARVRWCRRAITSRYGHARFVHMPVHNGMYSPGARRTAAKVDFPYADQSFDLAFLASVFTHMFDRDVERYVAEIARVLRPGGRCIATLYLLNADRRALISQSDAAFSFAIEHEGCWIETKDSPEAAVAHDEARICAMFASQGLRAIEPFRYGAWDRSRAQDQDFLTFAKSASPN